MNRQGKQTIQCLSISSDRSLLRGRFFPSFTFHIILFCITIQQFSNIFQFNSMKEVYARKVMLT